MKMILALLCLFLLIQQSSSAKDGGINISTVPYLDVCEVNILPRLNRSGNASGWQMCTLCFIGEGSEIEQQTPLTFKNVQKSIDCTSFDSKLSGSCIASNVNWTRSDDTGFCDLRNFETLADDAGAASLILTIDDSTLQVPLEKEDFVLPTIIIYDKTLQLLISDGVFETSSNMTIRASVFTDTAWEFSGIMMLAVIAVINVITSVLLSLYDVRFAAKKDQYEQAALLVNPDEDSPSEELNQDLQEHHVEPISETNNGTKTIPQCDHNQQDEACQQEIVTSSTTTVNCLKSSCSCVQDTKTEQRIASVMTVLVALTVAVTALILIFFFHTVLWYVMVVLYFVVVCLAFSSFGARVFDRFTFALNLSTFHKSSINVMKYGPGCVIGAAAASLWLVFLHKKWIWILWDVLSFSVCLHVLSQSRLPSFKVLTIMCVLFLVYDGIAVYLTPLFTDSGKSVMEEAALGPQDDGGGGDGTSGNSKSKSDASQFLPMLFLARPISFGKQNESPCVGDVVTAYNILGMGDVIIPGFLVVHAGLFGLVKSLKPSWIYVVVSVLAYCLSFACVYISLTLMQSAQPALVFIIPICLPTILITAALRKEFSHLMESNIIIQSSNATTAGSKNKRRQSSQRSSEDPGQETGERLATNPSHSATENDV